MSESLTETDCDTKDIPSSSLYVIKRNGIKQPVKMDKITARLNKLAYGLKVDPTLGNDTFTRFFPLMKNSGN